MQIAPTNCVQQKERGFKIKVGFKNRPLVHLEDLSVSCTGVLLSP